MRAFVSKLSGNGSSYEVKMAKKRKISDRNAGGPKAFDEKDGKIGFVRTYEDLSDSEDEFHINRDKILLDEGPGAKRRRQLEEYGKPAGIHLFFSSSNGWQTLSWNPQTKKS